MRKLATRARALGPRYRKAQREVQPLYRAWRGLHTPPELVHPLWEEGRQDFADLIDGGVPIDFLSRQIVRHMLYRTGFGELEQIQLEYLQTTDPAIQRLCRAYREPWVGEPLRDARPPIRGSVSSLNKLYYFARIGEMVTLGDLRTVVDFGGGYGLMCNVLQQLVVPRPTVVIVDLPELLALQYVVLRASSTAPVVGHTDLPIRLQPGAANLLPVQLVAESGLSCDLFISTFALSETPPQVQRAVADGNFYEATSLYITGQDIADPLWREYGFAEMRPVVAAAQRRFADIRLEPFPVVSAWELTATNVR